MILQYLHYRIDFCYHQIMKTYPQYYIAYEKDPKRGYIASAPSIPGCVVYGKTVQEAYRNIKAAIRECLEVREEFKKPLPRETISPAQAQRFSFVQL